MWTRIVLVFAGVLLAIAVILALVFLAPEAGIFPSETEVYTLPEGPEADRLYDLAREMHLDIRRVEFGGIVRIYSRELIAALVVTLAAVLFSVYIIVSSRAKIKLVQSESKLTKALLETEEYARLMLDSGPICCQLWSRDYRILDCNEAALTLYGFSTKQEYITRWVSDCSPKYQPDGTRSDIKSMAMLKKAFEEGRCEFEWMHQTIDGAPMPSEVTLVRIRHRDEFVTAGYTRDMRQVVELEEKANKIYYDALTGIYSRRYLDENFKNLLQSISRSGSMLSVLMIDIDHFKQYNDIYGHSTGDKCLKAVADVLMECIARQGDFVARYGGEEFIAVLPNTDEAGARLIAEKMLENIRGRNIEHKGNGETGYVTFSIGSATGIVRHPEDGELFVKEADRMLYESKNSGRDRYTSGTV